MQIIVTTPKKRQYNVGTVTVSLITFILCCTIFLGAVALLLGLLFQLLALLSPMLIKGDIAILECAGTTLAISRIGIWFWRLVVAFARQAALDRFVPLSARSLLACAIPDQIVGACPFSIAIRRAPESTSRALGLAYQPSPPSWSDTTIQPFPRNTQAVPRRRDGTHPAPAFWL